MDALKEQLYQKASDLGAAMVKTTPVERWESIPIQDPAFWPQNIWPWCKSVIVLAIPMFLPMAGSTPSMVYQELYNTSNRVMDDMAYQLANCILRLGWRASFFPRDCYAGIKVLLKNPAAAFSHVVAGYYAGIGTFGDSHNLITRAFGPRVRLVSVLTDAPIPPDEMLKENLCIHCGLCLRACPATCFSERPGELYGYDKRACTEHHVRLAEENHFPCGLCANVCPVGNDQKMYKDQPAITKEGILHLQSFGS